MDTYIIIIGDLNVCTCSHEYMHSDWDRRGQANTSSDIFSVGSDIASLRIALLQTPPIDYTVLYSI